MWVPDLSGFDGARYLALARAIYEAIDNGELPAGAQLPPQRELAQKLGVTVGTVGRAYKIVKARRLVTGEVGRGTFVRGASASSDANRSFLPQHRPGTIDFALMSTVSAGLSESLFAACTEAVGITTNLPMNRYPPPVGFPSHRTAGANWIARSGYDAPIDQVMVFNGAQQALMCILLALSDRAKPELLCESLTYSGVKALCSLLGHNMRGIEIDAQGMIPAALERALEDSHSRLLYLQPSLLNPTGAVMPLERRVKIAEIARRHGVTIIEDDCAIAGLRKRPAPIASLLPGQTILLSGLSKVVSPALRIAYAAVPPQFIDRLAHTLHAMTLANAPFMGEAAAHLINSGAADRHAEQQYDRLAAIHALLQRKLAGYNVSSNPNAFFLWLPLPDHWTAREFCDAAQRINISVVPSDNYIASGAPPPAIRLSLNPAHSVETYEQGIEQLLAMFEERRTPQLIV